MSANIYQTGSKSDLTGESKSQEPGRCSYQSISQSGVTLTCCDLPSTGNSPFEETASKIETNAMAVNLGDEDSGGNISQSSNTEQFGYHSIDDSDKCSDFRTNSAEASNPSIMGQTDTPRQEPTSQGMGGTISKTDLLINAGRVRIRPPFRCTCSRREKKNPNCSYCGKFCYSHRSRKIHEAAIHRKERHACSLCDKTFSFPQSVGMHVRAVHLNEKRFECAVCSKQYFQLANLKEHVHVHLPDRRIECPLCNRSYVRLIGLVGHMKIVHPEASEKCNLCGKTFAFIIGLKTHLKNFHSINTPENLE